MAAKIIPCNTRVCTIIKVACVKYLKLFTVCKNLAIARLTPGDHSLWYTVCAADHRNIICFIDGVHSVWNVSNLG